MSNSHHSVFSPSSTYPCHMPLTAFRFADDACLRSLLPSLAPCATSSFLSEVCWCRIQLILKPFPDDDQDSISCSSSSSSCCYSLGPEHSPAVYYFNRGVSLLELVCRNFVGFIRLAICLSARASFLIRARLSKLIIICFNGCLLLGWKCLD